MKLGTVFLLFLSIVIAYGDTTTNCTCGQYVATRGSRVRIVGGVDAKPEMYPYLAAISINSDPEFIKCGSTVITEWHAISAAHCNPGPLRPASLILGVHDVEKVLGEGTEVIPIKKFINHDEYNKEGYTENDITLIVLTRAITFGPSIVPACFPKADLKLVGAKVKIIGWGAIKEDGPSPKTLQEVFVDVQPTSKCAEKYDEINSRVLCTYTKGKDACQGDSGGSVLYHDAAIQRFVVVGVVSFGTGCATDGMPGVNSNVIAYRQWILKKIAETVPSAQTCMKQ